MATWDDVKRLALELPEVVPITDINGYKWEVHKAHFAYERPLRQRDLEDLGDAAPTGDILGVRVATFEDRLGLIGSNPDVFFTIPHYANYPAVLVLLEKITVEQLREVLTDAWLARAPKGLAAQYLSRDSGS